MDGTQSNAGQRPGRGLSGRISGDFLEDERILCDSEMASILAWRVPWMEEPAELQSMGSRRVDHD